MKQSIEPRELAIEIGIAAVEERLLFSGADAAARRLAVLAVERVGDVHAFDDLAERHEALRVLSSELSRRPM